MSETPGPEGLEEALEMVMAAGAEQSMSAPVRTRREWFSFGFDWGKRKLPVPPEKNGGVGFIELDALTFLNPLDGSEEVFYFEDHSKQQLMKQMTGGIVIPK